jgi:ribosomal protein L23
MMRVGQMDDISIIVSLKKRQGEIKDTILHSHTVCVNSVEIMIRGQMNDVHRCKPEREKRNKGYNITLTFCVK